ncbi:hypothetical protein GC197_11755 [bacterium]|nr:hypothetical protein [bacterium]
MRASLVAVALLSIVLWQIPAFSEPPQSKPTESNSSEGPNPFADDVQVPSFDPFQKPAEPAVCEACKAATNHPLKNRPEVVWLGVSGKVNQKILDDVQQQLTKIQFIESPLEDVVGYLKNLHHQNVVIDRRGIEDAGWDVDMPITMNIDNVMLNNALNLLCHDNDLGWYVDNEAIVITSAQAARQHTSVRVYELGNLSGEETINAIESILETSPGYVSNVSPAGFGMAPGQAPASPAGIGQIPSKNAIVVRQNREGHDLIRSLILSLNGFES